MNSFNVFRFADAYALLDVKLLDLAFDDQLMVMRTWIENLTEDSLQLIRGQLQLFTFVTAKQLKMVITMIYDTALSNEERFIYARVCLLLANKTDDNFGSGPQVTTFSHLLLNHKPRPVAVERLSIEPHRALDGGTAAPLADNKLDYGGRPQANDRPRREEHKRYVQQTSRGDDGKLENLAIVYGLRFILCYYYTLWLI